MNIAIGCDHRGLALKKMVIHLIQRSGHEYNDCGCFTPYSVDYPDIAYKVTKLVVDGICERGILICGTGIGMSIAANKMRGIRAALCRDYLSARRARNHNNANVLCLGAEFISDELNEIIRVFLNDGFEGGRHQRRLDKVTGLESQV